ncbi:amino acid racemase [candidate division KSB1 bacterium]|nr:amino acid racemase [candidate division KSB1 bacterium]
MYKKIGILGGLSPESTIEYYRYITRKYYELFGDYNYPEIIIYGVNFQQFINWQREGNWNNIVERLVQATQAIHAAGADFGLIATNTMHIIFDKVQEKSPIPLISIIEATATAINKEKIETVGLLGTLHTMREQFYKEGLFRHGIKTIVPEPQEQEFINKVIYDELTRGRINQRSKQAYIEIINKLKAKGAEGIVLGCTEIPLLVQQIDCNIKLFNTTQIHAQNALNLATNTEVR